MSRRPASQPLEAQTAAYYRGMAKMCRERGYSLLAESYEMGAKDVETPENTNTKLQKIR